MLTRGRRYEAEAHVAVEYSSVCVSRPPGVAAVFTAPVVFAQIRG